MSVTSPTLPPEVLIARKVPWRKRLWVRLSVPLLVIVLLTTFMWWWPRRGMVAVWRVNGKIFSHHDKERTTPFVKWWDRSLRGWAWKPANEEFLRELVSSTGSDAEVYLVQLDDAPVDDRWLIRLRRFPDLQLLFLHNRQVGPGLDELRNSDQLWSLMISSASNQSLLEMHRLPQLEELWLKNPQPGDIGLNGLSRLPKLREILFDHSQHTSEHLASLPELFQVEGLSLRDCKGFTEQDLSHLQKLPHLKRLSLVRSGRVSDQGLMFISQLPSLEYLSWGPSTGPISDQGLEAVSRLSNLKELSFGRGVLTRQQLDLLRKRLPHTAIQP